MSLIYEMEWQLERSRRMSALGKMAAGIAHEIRNPLGTLRGFAQYFGGETTDQLQSKKFSELMVSEVDRLNTIVSGLLQFSRPKDLTITTVNLDQVVSKAIELLNIDLNSKSISCVKSSLNLSISGDADQLLQVIMNLIKNSIEATEDNGQITISCKKENDSVILSVEDDGRGMDEKECEKMFDPFLSTRKLGTGLGLSVSHQIIEQHGATFQVGSKRGEGTKISILFSTI